jgi:hypothetical protein
MCDEVSAIGSGIKLPTVKLHPRPDGVIIEVTDSIDPARWVHVRVSADELLRWLWLSRQEDINGAPGNTVLTYLCGGDSAQPCQLPLPDPPSLIPELPPPPA